MTSTTPQSQPLGRRADQQLLFECDDEGTTVNDLQESSKAQRRNSTRRTPSASQSIGTEAIGELLRALVGPLEARLTTIEALLQAVVDMQTKQAVVKEFYSTKEAALILGKRPYTVREWCRLGRVNAEKAEFGRGLDEEWRISHDELHRIQNEGLLALKECSQVAAPKRLAR